MSQILNPFFVVVTLTNLFLRNNPTITILESTYNVIKYLYSTSREVFNSQKTFSCMPQPAKVRAYGFKKLATTCTSYKLRHSHINGTVLQFTCAVFNILGVRDDFACSKYI